MRSDNKMNAKNVFVVHGRNDHARTSMFSFLRSIGLHPLEWSQIVKATGKSSPYIGEVLDKGFSMAQAVVVLLTPDDEARLREQLRKENEQKHESVLTPQPRQNVLIEAGMAIGMFPDRTILVELGTLRPISDLGGRHVVRLNNSAEQRHELAQRLQTVGCSVDITGKDWYREGNFDLNGVSGIIENRASSKTQSEKLDDARITNGQSNIESHEPILLHEDILAEKIDSIAIDNLVIIVLRSKSTQTRSEIQQYLLKLGRNVENWFKAGHLSKLIASSIVIDIEKNTDGEKIFSLSKKGEKMADSIIEKYGLRI